MPRPEKMESFKFLARLVSSTTLVSSDLGNAPRGRQKWRRTKLRWLLTSLVKARGSLGVARSEGCTQRWCSSIHHHSYRPTAHPKSTVHMKLLYSGIVDYPFLFGGYLTCVVKTHTRGFRCVQEASRPQNRWVAAGFNSVSVILILTVGLSVPHATYWAILTPNYLLFYKTYVATCLPSLSRQTNYSVWGGGSLNCVDVRVLELTLYLCEACKYAKIQGRCIFNK